MTVLCGIPQGTILGPLLFILYINDIFNSSRECETISFADDTALIIKSTSWELALVKAELSIAKISNWLSINCLSLNIKKTNYITYGSYQNSLPINTKIQIHENNCNKINCHCPELTRVQSTKYLGIVIDENLKWCAHVKNVIEKTRYLIYIFYKLRNLLSTKHLLIIYYALFWSTATYGMIAWGGVYDSNIKNLKNIHKRIVKIIFKKNYLYPSNQLFVENKIISLQKFYIEKSIKRNFENLQKTYFTNVLLNKRQPNLTLPKTNKNIAKRNHYYLSLKIFNE